MTIEPRYNALEIPPLRCSRMLWGIRTCWWGSAESSAWLLCAQEVWTNTVCSRCLIAAVGGSASSAGMFLEQGVSRSDLLLGFLTAAALCCLWATESHLQHWSDVPHCAWSWRRWSHGVTM